MLFGTTGPLLACLSRLGADFSWTSRLHPVWHTCEPGYCTILPLHMQLQLLPKFPFRSHPNAGNLPQWPGRDFEPVCAQFLLPHLLLNSRPNPGSVRWPITSQGRRGVLHYPPHNSRLAPTKPRRGFAHRLLQAKQKLGCDLGLNRNRAARSCLAHKNTCAACPRPAQRGSSSCLLQATCPHVRETSRD